LEEIRPEVKVDRKFFVVAAVPAYNEEASIAKVVLKAQKYVDQVIVCDDGSSDYTADIAEALGAFVIRHDKNLGYGASMLSLFREARRVNVDVMVTLDADSQHDPDEIPVLLEKLSGDLDIVIGSRFVEGGGSEAPPWRNFGIKFINRFTQGDSVKTSDSQSGFRAYSSRALDALTLTEDGMGISTEILLKAGELGLHVADAPIHVKYGVDSSTHNPVTHGVDVVLNTVKHISLYHPLLFYGVPGLASVVLSLFFWVITIEAYARSETLLTNAALLGIGTMLVGLMLITTAIILWVMTTLIQEQSNRLIKKSSESKKN
jgi:glycosyltransferase involved in cell wall biosynthesis